jgi:phage-related protein
METNKPVQNEKNPRHNSEIRLKIEVTATGKGKITIVIV